jgi:hypothetical protein
MSDDDRENEDYAVVADKGLIRELSSGTVLVEIGTDTSGTVSFEFANGPIATPEISGDFLETHIDGDFEGWDDNKIYKLDNGQVWQQSSYHYYYHYAYHPEVVVYKSHGRWRMVVKGDSDEAVSVQRLK